MIETPLGNGRGAQRVATRPGGMRQRGNNGVLPRPRVRLLLGVPRLFQRLDTTTIAAPANPRHAPAPHTRTAERSARIRPAALEWRDARLPVLGRLWATAWLPSVLLAGCVVALMYLLQTSGVATTGYDIQRLQAERDDWSLRNEQLQLELAKRRSLTWIEAEAVGRLGMVKAEPTALTYLKAAR